MVAVLQAWSKGTTTEHLLNLSFVVLFGCGALWGARTLLGRRGKAPAKFKTEN